MHHTLTLFYITATAVIFALWQQNFLAGGTLFFLLITLVQIGRHA